MIFQFLVIAIFTVLGFTSAHDSRNKCSKHLEEIVYQPESTSRNYLTRLAAQINIASPVLWTPSNTSFLENFENSYGVSIVVYDAFGFVLFPLVEVVTLKSILSLPLVAADEPANMFSVTATANMNGAGFTRDNYADLMYYEFIVYNVNGELKYIQIQLNTANAPLFK